MTLQEAMQEQVFAVAGNTLQADKYAYQIKQELLEKGYTVYAVGKELASFNDIPEPIGVIDLCINAARGLALLKACTKSYRGVVIQPGAESEELLAWLEKEKIPYVQGCVLVGMRLYPRNR